MLVRMIKDNLTDANAELFSGMMNFIARQGIILEKKNPFSYTNNIITVKSGTVLTIKNGVWKSFRLEADVDLSEIDLDTGSFEVGKDYYVYFVDDGADGQFVISLNSTFPAGYNADNSRKIGGFHFGHVRKVSADGLWIPVDSEGTRFGNGAINWKNNVSTGILPNSVWDLVNRPKCSPEGMVKIGNLWVDIYQSSAAETITFQSGVNGLHVATGKLQSRYGQIPVTGTEGLNYYNFSELASRSGKRLLSYSEWVKGAFGNPEGEDGADNYGQTKTSNTGRTRTGVRVNASTGAYDAASGVKPYAISAYNLVDCVGNVWEWLDDIAIAQDSTSWAWHDVLGAGMGDAYLPNATGIRALIAGASWAVGVHAGPRAVSVNHYPWFVNSSVGSRLACDSL